MDPRCQASCVAVSTAIALMLMGEDDVDVITQKATDFALPVSFFIFFLTP